MDFSHVRRADSSSLPTDGLKSRLHHSPWCTATDSWGTAENLRAMSWYTSKSYCELALTVRVHIWEEIVIERELWKRKMLNQDMTREVTSTRWVTPLPSIRHRNPGTTSAWSILTSSLSRFEGNNGTSVSCYTKEVLECINCKWKYKNINTSTLSTSVNLNPRRSWSCTWKLKSIWLSSGLLSRFSNIGSYRWREPVETSSKYVIRQH